MSTTEIMRAALTAASERFREYEEHHRTVSERCAMKEDFKGQTVAIEKAIRNREIAEVCEDALEQPDPRPAEPGILVRLDLAENGQIREAYRLLRLPAVPMPGEGLAVGQDKFRVAARIHIFDDSTGDYVCGLLVEKPAAGAAPLVTAPASALDQLRAAEQRRGPLIGGGR